MSAFPPPNDLPSEKVALRRWARTHRSTLDRAALSRLLSERLVAQPEFQFARHILFYLPTNEEIGVEALADRFPERRWYAPRCLPGHRLTIHSFVPGKTGLRTNRWGLREPAAEAKPITTIASLDLVVVPGLLFTSTGDRLGYGGGYYDRLLPMLSPTCVCASVVPDALLIESLPTEAWDIPMDLIVTETQIFRPDGRRMRYIERNETNDSRT